MPVWRMAVLSPPCPVTTAFTIGLGSATDIRRKARGAREYGLIKLKVDHERHVDLVRIVRAARARSLVSFACTPRALSSMPRMSARPRLA